MATLSMFNLGLDCTERGAIISSTAEQASKPLGMVRDYIANKDNQHPELRLVFPELQQSPHEDDPWTQTKIVVKRPSGIRDPSLKAVGVGGALPGSRLRWINVDDILDEENTRNHDGRSRVNGWFMSTVLSRADAKDSRLCVTNTPWHREDLTYKLEEAGFPTLEMNIEGQVSITNTDWDTDEVRPSYAIRGSVCRLASHDSESYGAPEAIRLRADDPLEEKGEHILFEGNASLGRPVEPFDVAESIPLWPERYDREVIDKKKVDYKNSMHEYNRLFMLRTRSEEGARVQKEWIERAKLLGRTLGMYHFVSEYLGPNLTVTGVDLAVSRKKGSDFTCFVTVELVPNITFDLREDGVVRSITLRNARRILEVDIGRWKGRTIVDKLIDKCKRYNSIARVETNAAQDFLRQWTIDEDTSVPVKAHNTGRNKIDPRYGVESVFVELENGAWIFPSDIGGAAPEALQVVIDDCLYYNPTAHTGDGLMATWLAREQIRAITGDSRDYDGAAQPSSLGASLTAR
jgi:hypothetical protein